MLDEGRKRRCSDCASSLLVEQFALTFAQCVCGYFLWLAIFIAQDPGRLVNDGRRAELFVVAPLCARCLLFSLANFT